MKVGGLRRGPDRPLAGRTASALVPDLGDLLAAADHVVVAAPATPATHHLIDEAAFSGHQTGRPLRQRRPRALVDQDALVEALDDGRVARPPWTWSTPSRCPPATGSTPTRRCASPRTSPGRLRSTVRRDDRALRGEPLAATAPAIRLLGAVDLESRLLMGLRTISSCARARCPEAPVSPNGWPRRPGAGFASVSLWGATTHAHGPRVRSDGDLRPCSTTTG